MKKPIQQIAALTILSAIGIIRAQTLPPPPAYTYDVVSIHRSSPDARRLIIGPGHRVACACSTLRR